MGTNPKPARRKRIVVEVPDRVHIQIRLRCVVRKIAVREYILELLKQDGIK